ncbi:MAG: hypothetical protein J7L54_05515 [Elusimicrobia bacterium]|nr:hypothetical protein [Elusimicrobiota bacterium]
MKIKEIIDFFFKSTVRIKILVYLFLSNKKEYILSVSKRIDATYAFTQNEVDALEKIGLLKTKRSGRKKYIELTEKGKKMAKLLYKVCKILKNIEAEKEGGV